jgi:hypothetical protein
VTRGIFSGEIQVEQGLEPRLSPPVLAISGAGVMAATLINAWAMVAGTGNVGNQGSSQQLAD